MSMIVAARFETFDQASIASAHLFREGFTEDDVHTFYTTSPGAHGQFPIGGDQAADPDAKGGQFGALAGAASLGLLFALVVGLIAALMSAPIWVVIAGGAVGAYIGSLAGAMWIVGKGKKARDVEGPMRGEHPAVRHAGVMLALHVTPERERIARDILKQAGGRDIERAQGRWREGKWEDYDPTTPPEHVERPAVTPGVS